jgi:uncharacterized membrane protein
MKYISIILILFSLGCTQVISQQPNEDMKKQKEFEEVLKKAKLQREKNLEVIKEADKKTQSTIKQTTEKIVTLKQEVKELKQELNEINFDNNSSPKFKFLPISDSSENK